MLANDPGSGPRAARKFVLEFTKMSGAGNDFIVIDNRFYRFSPAELSTMAARWCPRRTGVGADGLLSLDPAEGTEDHYRMRYYNADGSLGTMCGNGARCLARYARDAGISGEPLIFTSDAGTYRASVQEGAPVHLFVPAPRHFDAQPSLETAHPFGRDRCHFVWTGTEHLVVFVDDVVGLEISHWGPLLRRDGGLGSPGANVNFVTLEDAGSAATSARLRVRTFEKGVEAETLACGTGSIASSMVAALTGRSEERHFDVHMPGGVLGVGFSGPPDAPEALYLEGPADVIYRGSLEL
jgi:diaminopimelate epimerase